MVKSDRTTATTTHTPLQLLYIYTLHTRDLLNQSTHTTALQHPSCTQTHVHFPTLTNATDKYFGLFNRALRSTWRCLLKISFQISPSSEMYRPLLRSWTSFEFRKYMEVFRNSFLTHLFDISMHLNNAQNIYYYTRSPDSLYFQSNKA